MSSELILIYALKSTLVTAILYAYYLIALRDNKFHYYNRFYLLGSLVLSIIIPLLDLNWFTYEKQVTESTNLELIKLLTESKTQVIESKFTWSDGLLLMIGIIGIAFLGMLLYSIQKIYSIKRKSPIRYLDGIDFIETEVENAPFSFLNNLFWKNNMSLEDEKGQKIFKHEITHINQKHSWDRLFCQVLSSILWINPFNWIIQKELQTIHEFIADEEAIGENNTETFAKLLLETHYGTHFLNPIHPFNYSSIKRRLTMLTKSNNTKYSYLRRVMALPIILMALAIFSIKVNAVNRIQNLENKIAEKFTESQADTIKEKTSGEKKAVILEKINSDKGTEKKKIVIIDGKATISDLKPEDIESIQMIKKEGVKIEAISSKEKAGKELRIEGVEFKGEVDNNDLMIITSKSKNGESKKIYMIDPSDKSENKKLFIVDQNSKDAIENAVKRIKGRETMNVTVTDIREEVKADTVIIERAKSGKNDIGEAVYMIDGKKVESSAFKNLKPDDIQSVTVLRGENAEKKYGDLKGKGVIEVITKKK